MNITWATWVLTIAIACIIEVPTSEAFDNIPRVGTGRRSQFHVQRRDGTFTYGHDTGEGAFENVKRRRDGRLDGEYGYTDDDGNAVKVQYEAGRQGFVARGSHLPTAQSSFDAAIARDTGRAKRPFTDPLANPNADASYSFQFTEDGQSRSENSDSKGNVRGSYSFTDDEGRKRSYSYRAGRKIGFVIQGNDISQPQSSGSVSTISPTKQSLPFQQQTRGTHQSATFQSPSPATSGVLTYSALEPQRPSLEQVRVKSSNTPAHGQFEQQSFNVQTLTSLATPVNQPTGNVPRFPSGNQVLNYKTPTHERRESIGLNNKVAGNFAFTTEDDGIQRALQYEASADTGFTVDGDHLQVGPVVPGAPSGKPTGRLASVKTTSLMDPLANPYSDASYNFAFNSEQYSRSESSDSNGNVQGTYTIVDDDGTRRTHNFRAGTGIGFELQPVRLSKGPRPTTLSSSSVQQLTPSFKTVASSMTSSFSPHASSRDPSSNFRTNVAPQLDFNLQRKYGPNEFGYVLTYNK